MTTDEQIAALPRRQVLCGIMAVGLLGTTALTACSEAAPATNTQDDATGGDTAVGGALATLAQVPVGGGTVVNANGTPLVLLQPAPGEVRAYNAACTHAGTPVSAPENEVMTCPNHGSKFSTKDGSVINGPAGTPLKEVSVKVDGENIVLA